MRGGTPIRGGVGVSGCGKKAFDPPLLGPKNGPYLPLVYKGRCGVSGRGGAGEGAGEGWAG